MFRRRSRRIPHEPVPASREILRQVRRIDLRTRGPVNSRFSGEYQSVFKGQGIEFAEVRPYQPGDDVRAIDWNVTARTGEPHLKRYVEERELTVMMVVDLSGSQRWATKGRLKSEVVVEVAATLAMSAVRNNDRVGMLLVTDRVEWFVPPRKGRRHVLRLVRDLLAFEPVGRGTDLAAGLDYVARLAPARSIVFVFSDFRLGAGWDDFSATLTGAAARHDVVAVRIADPADESLPDFGLLAARDPETGDRVHLDTGQAGGRQPFQESVTADAELAGRLFRRRRVDEIVLRTDEPFGPELAGFFERRERRLRR